MKTADARRLGLVLGLLIAGAALGGPHYVSSRDWGQFLWVSQHLEAGRVYTFETSGLVGSSPDTVLHVLRDRGGFSQVAANDDCPGGGLRSCVTFTAPDTGYYFIWVRAYSDGRGGTAHLLRNGTQLLANQPFGGGVVAMTWSANDTFRVAGTTPAANDYMLFLLRSTTDYLAHDDDSGPRLYPALTVASSQTSGSERVVVGRYPGSTGTAHLVHDEQVYWTPYVNNDVDQDGLTNGLETLLGLNTAHDDTDGDTVSDKLELLGNDGFSFSEWGLPGLRDLYVEIDWMEHPTNPYLTRKPYAGLVADATTLFTQDSDSSIRLHAFVDGALPWSEVVCFGACEGSGTDFYALKQSHFSSSNPERRPYFHYVMWAYRHTNNLSCSSGLAELLGNDVIISLACWSSPSQADQRGTFIHELGHNLALSHNGNDVANKYSTVHNSVMNYRYQFAGVAGTGRHTYSFGTNGCAACSNSPKAACAECRDGLLGCGWAGCDSCDCDVNEWATLALDYSDDGDASDGSSTDRPLPDVFGPNDKAGLHLPVPPVPHLEPPVPTLLEEVRARRARLHARGLREGRDYLVSADGTRLYTSCP